MANGSGPIAPVETRISWRPDGNALRAAVLGANDGLVSNFSLVMGVAGASGRGHAIVVAGIAGLLAGSLSMALGEWLSVQSSRELYAREVALQALAIDRDPEREAEVLSEAYQAKGMTAADARMLARHVVTGDRQAAIDMTVREHLGIDPRDLGGSAWTAAVTSFLLFGLGAVAPLLPFLFSEGVPAVVISAALSGSLLFVLGAGITVMTGRNAVLAGARQLAFGMAAAAVTYGVGTLLGTAVG